MNIAIFGAGISGLSAAYRLTQLVPADTVIHVFDRRNRVGGVLETLHRDGFQIEQSADNFITTLPWGLQLCKELGLADQVVQTNPNVRRTYVVCRGGLYLLPDGFLMMAPTKLLPIATTPVLSWLGKLRAGLELFIPARKDDVDESMANFVRRRLGREVFERLVEPLVSGVYAADMEKLSVFATLPRFREMERNDGSLIRAMKKQLAANKAAHLAEQSGARFSMFVTLRNGLSALAETLAQRLPSDSLKLNRNVTGIKKLPDGSWIVESRKVEFPAGRTDFQTVSCWPVPFRQEDGDSGDAECSSIRYDAVILALPVHESAELLRQPLPELAAKLSQIKHEGTAIATLAFDAGQVKQIFRGMGFVVPKIEHNPILAGSFSSLKYGHRAPSDKFLLRIFAGGARASDLVELPDQQLVPILLNEMRKILKIDGSPLFSTVSHWPRTMPQYHVGHRELVKEIEWLTDAEKSLGLAGNAFHGVGIPNCIQSGFQAAEKLAASCRYFPDSIGGGMNEE